MCQEITERFPIATISPKASPYDANVTTSQKLWVYNYDFEFDLAGVSPVYYTGEKFSQWALLNRSSNILLPFCGPNDILVSYKHESNDLDEYLTDRFPQLPERLSLSPLTESNAIFVDLSDTFHKPENPSKFTLSPWGWSSAAIRFSSQFGQHLPFSLDDIYRINSKRFSTELRSALYSDDSDFMASRLITDRKLTKSQFMDLLEEYAECHNPMYIKHFLGTSGKLADQLLSNQISNRKLNRWYKWLRSGLGIILEKKVRFIREWGLQLEVDGAGKIHPLGLTRLYSSKNGSYLYSMSIQEDQSQIPQFIEKFESLFNEIRKTDYVGPFGLDIMEVEEGKMILLEINARLTMGRVAWQWHSKNKRFPAGLFGNIFYTPVHRMSFEEFQRQIGMFQSDDYEIIPINWIHQGEFSQCLATFFIASNSADKSVEIFEELKVKLKNQ